VPYLPGHYAMKRRAFTLIETLVVMAVITVLLAILLPAAGLVRAAAKRVECQTGMRSLGTGLQMAVDASGGMIEAESQADARSASYGPWTAASRFLDVPLPRYVEGADVETDGPWACPADDFAHVTGYSYHYTPTDFYSVTPRAAWRQVSEMYLDRPAAIVLLDRYAIHRGDRHTARNALRMDGSVRVFNGSLGIIP
jgi:prepilin-type N-terminal cleavage/methylation domain-containing protein